MGWTEISIALERHVLLDWNRCLIAKELGKKI
jgi:hypothetical protein